MIECKDCTYYANSECMDPYDWHNTDGDIVCRYQEGAVCAGARKANIEDIILLAHKNAVEKGFWEKSQNISEKLMLIVTEIAEGAEAVRNDNIESAQPGSASLLEELADTVIRICDLCGHLNLDLDTAIRLKMEYNKTREYLHGKKF